METKTVSFEIEVTRAQFRAALIFSADKDIRYYLNGVCLHVGECGDARLVATDGHRLAIVKLCDASSAAPGEYLIPRDVIKNIKRAGRYDKYALLLKINGDTFQIVDPADNQIIGGAKLIDGRFPDFQRVIPDPAQMSGHASQFNAGYIADIQKALIELGDKNGFFYMLQDGDKKGRGMVVRKDYGFLCVVMGMRLDEAPAAPDVAEFMPRRMPRAMVETAAGGMAFPFDAAQDVTDKRRQQLPAPPAVILVDIGTPADDADYLEYLASMAAPALQAAA